MSIIKSGALKEKWNQLKGAVKQQWSRLTDDDIARIDGDYDQLVGQLQETYGYSRERAEKEVNRYFGSPP